MSEQHDTAIYQRPDREGSMDDAEARLEGLRYRLDKVADDVPPHRVSGLYGQIRGREDSIHLTRDNDSEWWTEQMHKRIDDIEEELEYLEDWADGE